MITDKQKSMIIKLLEVIRASVIGLLFTLSTPGFNLWPLAFLASFSLAYIAHKGKLPFRITASICGFTWFSTSLYWLYIPLAIFGGASPIISTILIFLFMIFCSLLFWFPFGLVVDKSNSYMLGVLTFIALEFFKSTVPLGGMPWLNLGITQHNNLLSLQLVSIIGEHGLSFLTLVTGYLLYKTIYSKQVKRYSQLTVASLLVLFVFGGYLYYFKGNDGKNIRVKIIQTGVEQQVKWSDEYTVDIILNLNDNLKKANSDNTEYDFTIMPEAAYPIDPFEEEIIAKVIQKTSVKPLIIGYLKTDFKNNNEMYYNTAALVQDGEIIDEYYKIKLAPFGEYFPLEKYLYKVKDYFFQDILLPTRGIESKVFNIDGVKIGIMICYDGVFTKIWKDNINKGANLIALISNDAWFGKSIGKKQHFAIDKIHAVEYGRYIIRSTQDGISGIITPYGEERLLPQDGFNTEILTVESRDNRTFFTFMGYSWYLIALLIYLFGMIIKKKRERK